MAKMALILAVLLGSAKAFAGVTYSCEINELDGRAVRTIEFSRNLIVDTELLGYTIEFQDYLGRVTATVTEKSNGEKVAEDFATAQMEVIGKGMIEFDGLVVDIPGVLKVTCQPSEDRSAGRPGKARP